MRSVVDMETPEHGPSDGLQQLQYSCGQNRSWLIRTFQKYNSAERRVGRFEGKRSGEKGGRPWAGLQSLGFLRGLATVGTIDQYRL